MRFDLSPEQQALADSVARFCERRYDPAARAALLDTVGGFSSEHWRTFAELGWLGAGLSEEAGGFGGGAVESMVIMEGFGRALVMEPFLPTALLSLQTLAALDPGDRRAALIATAVAGDSRLALAFGDASAMVDGTDAETRIRDGRISGAKSLVFGAPSADALLVTARGERGIGLYVVDPRAAGLDLRPYRLLDNSRAADLLFVEVTPETTLAEGHEAEAAIGHGVAHALVGVCAEAVGAMDAALQMTCDYVRTRRQFGTTLGSFQAVQHRLADMLVEIELSRSIVYHAIAHLDASPAQRDHALSAAKAVVSTAAMFVGRNAVQLHGGIGMTEEYPIGHYYRRLFVAASQFGGEPAHLRRVAASSRGFWEEWR